MIKRLLAVLTLLFFIPIALASAANADSIYMQVTDIKGESKVRGYESWIELNAFNFSVTKAVNNKGSGGGAGKANFNDIKITKYMDLSSTALLSNAATGKLIKSVVIDVVRDTGEDDYVVTKYTLSDVLVSSFNQAHSTGEDSETGVEEITLNYSKIVVTYTPVQANGKPGAQTKFSWDIAANRAL